MRGSGFIGLDQKDPYIVLMTKNPTFLQYTTCMNKLLITSVMLLAGCISPTAQIRESARQMSQDLGIALEAQDTILDSLDRLRGHTGGLEDVAVDIPSPQREAVLAHAAAIEEDAEVIQDSVEDTTVVLTKGTKVSAAILSYSDRVQDKPGWWNSVLAALSGYSWWIFAIIIFVLIGTLGLWPVVMNALINFMSAVGFGISRTREVSAKKLYRLQQQDDSEAANRAIEQLRASTLGEAAWRRVKRQERRGGKERRDDTPAS